MEDDWGKLQGGTASCILLTLMLAIGRILEDEVDHSAAILAIRKEVRRLDPERQESDYTYAVATLLLSSLMVGADVKRLSEFTGYAEGFVQMSGRGSSTPESGKGKR